MMENSEINQQLANAKLVQCKTYATPRAHLTSSHVQNGGLGKKKSLLCQDTIAALAN